MAPLRIVDDGPAPARVLCQTVSGSCASCCGVWNFRERSQDAMAHRLARRTALVRAAWPDIERLRHARDTLLDEERDALLSREILVCPFAGFVDDEATRVGCMIHPTRHPDGADLRDLAVYPREVCAGHFCAPHDWLTDVEKDVAACARGLFYGRVVTDAGLVKALVRLVEDALCRRLTRADVARATGALASLFRSLEHWPHGDPDPRRFGGFVVDEHAHERTITDPHLDAVAPRGPLRTVLDALGTRTADARDAHAAATRLSHLVDELARAVASSA